MSEATVVLVHGAWAGSWIFKRVIDELQARSVDAIAVDLPTCSATDTSTDVHDDAAHVRDVVRAIDGPVVLGGNSYGGAVITGAAVDAPNVKRLVYIAAAIPDAGVPILDDLNAASAPEFAGGIKFLDTGLVGVDAEVVVRAALNQALPEDHAMMRARLSQAMSFGADLSVSLPRVAWSDVPATYVVCTDDHSLSPEMQRSWAKERATDVIELPFDHCPQLSHPAEIADLLASAAIACSTAAV